MGGFPSSTKVSAVGGIQIVGTTEELPSSPVDGQVIWIAATNTTVVYSASLHNWYYTNGTGKFLGNYNLEITSMPLIAPAINTATAVSGGSMTAGTHRVALVAYNSTGGSTLIGVSSADITTGGADNSITITFDVGQAGVSGYRAYCTKANTTSPFYFTNFVDDNTTGSITITGADNTLYWPAPDVDFSRELPAGWIGKAGSDRVYNPVGATSNSILLTTSWPPDPTGSSIGTRAGFYLGETPPDNWTASWKMTRLLTGFPGTSLTDSPQYPIFAAAFNDINTAATIALGAYHVDNLPINSNNPLIIGRAYRNATSSPANAWTRQVVTANTCSPITSGTVPAYVKVSRRKDGSGDCYIFSISHDGENWNAPTGSGATLADRMSKWNSPSVLTSVGVCIERASTGYQGCLIEFTDFSWKIDNV